MISRIKGKVVEKSNLKIFIESGDFTYEVYTPRTVNLRLDEYIKEEQVQLVIYHYLHTDQNKSLPILIGFLSELEKEFFEKIITVAGIGPKAALNALDRSISEIAEAIEDGDVNYLKNLPGIGLQRAKNIVAFLQGKMGKFTLIKDKIEEKKQDLKDASRALLEEAEKVLLQLQYRKREAQEMIEKAFKSNPQIHGLEELLNQIYKQKS